MEDVARPIVVIEDSDEDFEMLRLTLSKYHAAQPLVRFSDGDAAVDFFKDSDSGYSPLQIPVLILLDLNLVGTDGREVLSVIKGQAWYSTIPVVILTTSANPKDVQNCYSAGANGYTVKPVDLDRYEKLISNIKEFWLDFNVVPLLP